MNWWNRVSQWWQLNRRILPPEPGVHHFERTVDGAKTRIHLRLEADGRALLLVNANHAYHLNPTAALMAYLTLHKASPAQAAGTLTRTYKLPRAAAAADYAAFEGQLEALLQPDGPCPICDLELDTLMPFSAELSAPYRMDLALTYRCNNDCAHCYNARPRSHPELTTDQWKTILDKLWQLGIPHVVFTGGEPTLRADLPDLIAHAEANGQITGLNTNGRRLRDPGLLQRLIDAGLDHVQITVESHDSAIHDAIVCAPGAWEDTIAGVRNALASRLYVMTNTTMLQSNSPHLQETLAFLADLGVPTVGLNALIYSGKGAQVGTGLSAAALPSLLSLARQMTDDHQQRLIWYTPTQYCHFDPIQMDLGVKGCTAALYNMCVEPDGQVLPCQSYYTSLGSLLTDSWDSIWNHDLAVRLRTRQNLPEACGHCDLLPECGGGCPLEWAVQPPVEA